MSEVNIIEYNPVFIKAHVPSIKHSNWDFNLCTRLIMTLPCMFTCTTSKSSTYRCSGWLG